MVILFLELAFMKTSMICFWSVRVISTWKRPHVSQVAYGLSCKPFFILGSFFSACHSSDDSFWAEISFNVSSNFPDEFSDWSWELPPICCPWIKMLGTVRCPVTCKSSACTSGVHRENTAKMDAQQPAASEGRWMAGSTTGHPACWAVLTEPTVVTVRG